MQTQPEAYVALLDEPRWSQILEPDALIRKAAPGLEPFVRSGMLAYDTYRYRHASGREGE